MATHQTLQVEGYAVIDGAQVDIEKYEASFSLNTIPVASITLSLGRDPGGRLATIHRIFDELYLRRPAQVFLKVTPGNLGPMADWPKGYFLAFDGFTTGAAVDRDPGMAGLQIGLTHWLDELSHGSMLCQTSSPRNPSDMVFNAVLPGAPAALTGVDQASAATTAEGIAADLGHEIFNWYRHLLDLGPNGIGLALETGIDLGVGLPQANAAVKRALARFEDGTYTFGQKLAMDATVRDTELVATAIQQHLSTESRDSTVAQTMWDKLVELAGQYMFAVVPMVDRCLLVPWTPLLRTTYKNGLSADLNSGFRPRLGMPRLLRGVAVVGGRGFESFNEQARTGPMDISVPGVGGVYAPFKSGEVAFVDAPRWMAGIDLTTTASDTAGVNGVRGAAQDPGVGAAPKGKTPKEQALNNAGLMNRFAQHMYGLKALEFRQGPLNGPLRFDIAPGSVVYVGQEGELFAGAEDRLAADMVGAVTTVSLCVDTRSKVAVTAFHLSHLRTLGENSRPGTSMVRHPLYKDTWSGAPLSGQFG